MCIFVLISKTKQNKTKAALRKNRLTDPIVRVRQKSKCNEFTCLVGYRVHMFLCVLMLVWHVQSQSFVKWLVAFFSGSLPVLLDGKYTSTYLMTHVYRSIHARTQNHTNKSNITVAILQHNAILTQYRDFWNTIANTP